jgi:cellulose biosynthesis protein BcsQ
MKPPIITFFNNKGGVGKTSTLYNLSSMFARRGKRVLAVDLDPQANLTSLALDEETLVDLWGPGQADATMQTIYHAVQPVIEATGLVQVIEPQKAPNVLNYLLLPGDLRLSQFEDKLASEWNVALGGAVSGLNVTSSFARLIHGVAEAQQADVVFVDVGPNLGAINRAALIASDYVVIPLVPDLFSLQGLKNVGKFLMEWRRKWQQALQQTDAETSPYPAGKMEPIGYIILQHRERQSRLVLAHQRWADRIPQTYSSSVLNQAAGADADSDEHLIGRVRNYQSLMAFSHEARKPVFDLKPADGAIGAHGRVVQESEQTYYQISDVIAERIGMTFLSDD